MEIYLGIDIGATKVCLARVSSSGEILDTDRYPISEYPDIREKLISEVSKFSMGKPVSGIGIGIKGMVAPDQKTIISSSVLKQCLPWDICGDFAGLFRVPVRIDNDVHAATQAEIMFGAGRTCREFVYINVGTGLAAGIVSEGRLIRGKRNISGEIGLTLFERSGVRTDIESVVSGKGLGTEAQRLREKYPDGMPDAGNPITGRDVAQAVRHGDPLALEAWKNCADLLAVTLFNLTVLLDPEMFILGGGVVSDGAILPEVRKRYEALTPDAHRPSLPEIRLSGLGADHVGVLGAAALAMQP